MIPILHLLREPESYLHTTAAGAWRENRIAHGFALLKNTVKNIYFQDLLSQHFFFCQINLNNLFS